MKTILILLMLTSVCLADKPNTDAKEFTENSFYAKSLNFNQNDYTVLTIKDFNPFKYDDILEKTIKVSCPDGYVLKYSMKDRILESLRDLAVNSNKGWEAYLERLGPSGCLLKENCPYTDAELKCVKEKR